MSTKKILIIANDFPYPPNHGARVDLFEKIVALKNLEFEITLIATYRDKIATQDLDFMRQIVTHLFLLKRQTGITRLFSFKPYQVTSRSNRTELFGIIEKIKNNIFDFCIIEGHACFTIAQELHQYVVILKSYLRIHNDEKIYFKQLAKATNNYFLKLFYLSESIKFSFYEKKIFQSNLLEALLHISSNELVNYRTQYPDMNHLFLPACINLENMTPYENKSSKKVLFIGSLFMPNNQEGLVWYLDKVHPQIIKFFGNYTFIIAGNTKGMNLKKFKKFLSKYTHIEFHDSPESLSEFYKEASLFINPMFSGTGVKLKTINAITEGVSIVSTSIGVEGTGLADSKHLLVANEPTEFIDSVGFLLFNDSEREKFVDASQKYLLEKYNLEKNLQLVLQVN